jgi:hypothetical protein
MRGRDVAELQSNYAALKAYGHSPAKAAEIILDAKRGDFFCERYVAFVHKSVAQPMTGTQEEGER